MNDDDRVLVDVGNRLNKRVPVMPWVEIVTVADVAFDSDVAFTRICVDENDSCGRGTGGTSTC